jgi:hypothetical protein
LDAFTFTLRVDRVDGRAKAYAGACGPSPADGRLDDDQLLRLYELLGELAFEGADAGGTGGMGGTGTGGMGGTGTGGMGGTGTGGTGTGGTGTGGTGGDGSTHPACIIGGKRYEHLDVVSRRGCASCVCLDGHIGGCTGACNGVDAGPPLSLPDCGIDGRLEGACAECADGNCSAYEFKCYTMGPNCESGSIHQCGAEQTCHTDVCTDEVQCG